MQAYRALCFISVLLLLVACGGDNGSQPQPNPLSITCNATPTTGQVPLRVDFQSTASGASGAFVFNWNFGDGVTSSSQNTAHTYRSAGSFTAQLTVTSGSESKTCSSNIQVQTKPLTVSCKANVTSGKAPLTVQFSSNVKGGSGDYSYDWDFDDGGHSSSEDPSHTYNNPDTYHPTLNVQDKQTGDSAECANPPSIRVDANSQPQPDIKVTAVDTDWLCATEQGSISVQNTGQAVLTITSISIPNATDPNGCLNFSQTNNCGSSLAVNASCSISVQCADNCGGVTRTGSVEIRSKDPDEAKVTVSIKGHG
jgi:PKD repeat protein